MEARRRDRESGQALVEFALILPLFLMIVVGVIQFGVALNFWLDMQRLANQGARSAAVNCGPSAATNQCGPSTWVQARDRGPSELPGVEDDGDARRAGSLQRKHPEVEICYVPPSQPPPAGWSPGSGDAVRVTLNERYRLQAIARLAKVDLTARATMRLEQSPRPRSCRPELIRPTGCSRRTPVQRACSV